MTLDLEGNLPKRRDDFATDEEWRSYREAIAAEVLAKFREIAHICGGDNLTVVRKDG